MSASMETRLSPDARVAEFGARGLAKISGRYLGLNARRQRVGDISVWDGEARFRLPTGLRSFLSVSLYVTVRRAPAEDRKDGAQATS